MNQRTRAKLGITAAFALLLFLGATAAIAEPDFTAECGGCHSVHPAYSMTSNATGTVNAYIGIPFTLTIDSSRPAMGGGRFFFSIQSGWANNDNFTFTPTLVEDNQDGDLDSSVWTISVEVTFTPQSLGSYTIRAWCASETGSRSIDIAVDVGESVPPTIDSPPDMQVSEGNMSAYVTWNPTDTYPDRYEVYDNEVLSSSDAWNGSSITIGLGTLSLGNHNLTIVVFDTSDNIATDQVDVLVVDAVLPVINHLDNTTISEGTLASLEWSPSDLNPSSFELYREESLIDSGIWSGGNITSSLVGLTIGEYNYTVVVFDTSGNSASDTTFVTVIDDTLPIIDNPDDIEYSEGSTGNTIVWVASDQNPSTFTIYRDEIIIRSDAWTGAPILQSIDGLAIGVYNYTVVVTDTSGNWVSDEVNVTVIFPPEPTLDHPADQIIDEGSTDNWINWMPDDVDPSRYEIYQDSILIKSGLWNSSSETISISIDGLSAGVYDFELIVYDDLDHTATDLVIVIVNDVTTPTIDSPSDFAINEGDIGQIIAWAPGDSNPIFYEIQIDGVLVWSGLWNSSVESIIASCDGLVYGTHVFTIIVTDVGDNSVSDEVTITVLDGTAPIVNSPADIVYQVATTGHNITWIPSDAHPSLFIIEINGVVILSGGWDGQPIFINVDWLSEGSYEYTLTVFDSGGNTETDIVIVTVTIDDPSATTTTETTTATTTSPGSGIPVNDDEQTEAATFSAVMLSMGIIIGVLGILLLVDRRRR
ncbi:MAG: hypothetical protein KGD60_01215 [Candidatus Thorarchaeota archaeon]|nr:hypothetical protein [Candidatus Thorarchaeota archaeon]